MVQTAELDAAPQNDRGDAQLHRERRREAVHLKRADPARPTRAAAARKIHAEWSIHNGRFDNDFALERNGFRFVDHHTKVVRLLRRSRRCGRSITRRWTRW